MCGKGTVAHTRLLKGGSIAASSTTLLGRGRVRAGAWRRQSDLHAASLAVQVVHVVLDVLMDLASSLDECILNVVGSLCRCLPEDEPMLLREF
eukprot:CAMPEP_0195030726 /NCGR_PEP_ID=MMETSP0326_2-20130528/59596_1 /TAXON_ID=2866 ORGANISM="Crypthecodinium cohnii, Strain Seligo" /NCGR_SAMPLE_ID=MMETSP0326_2 /ASSEMBLY_ACC=CAM_ASM_000348 /LENGTH=92 /DNA_ID=CAMNT_0040054139 /DNA_START=298 /DNA_END=573 /DNA_ORIENTATION=-